MQRWSRQFVDQCEQPSPVPRPNIRRENHGEIRNSLRETVGISRKSSILFEIQFFVHFQRMETEVCERESFSCTEHEIDATQFRATMIMHRDLDCFLQSVFFL